MDKTHIGILCYNLTPASTSIINKMAAFGSNYIVKAYPIFGPLPRETLSFEFRPAHKKPKTMNLNNIRGTAPEVQITALGVRVVRDLIKESDLICLIGLQGIPSLLASLSALLVKRPILTISQTMNPAAEKNRPLLIRLLKRIILKLSTYHIAHTPHTVVTLQANYKIAREKIVFIPWDGAAAEFIKVLKKLENAGREDIRARKGLSNSTQIILFCGSLFYLKGVDILIKAFARIVQEKPDSVLVIIGAGGQNDGQAANLIELANDMHISTKVIFTGSLQWEDLAQWYLASDLFVLPTRKDTWGKVLEEAALTGLPLITSEVCGGAGYLVKDNENGCIVPVDHVESLGRAILKLYDPIIRREYGKASKKIGLTYLEADMDHLYGIAVKRCLELSRK